MELTEVRIRNISNGGVLKAVASITIDNEFVIHDLKVIDSPNGMFVAMPNKQTKDGEYKDIAHPIKQSVRELIHGVVLDKYFMSIESGEG